MEDRFRPLVNRGEGAVLVVELPHTAKVDGADDVDIVKEKGVVRTAGRGRFLIALGSRCRSSITPFAWDDTPGPDSLSLGSRGLTKIFEEEPGRFFEAAAGVEQPIVFARNLDAHAKVVVGFQVVDDHIREMMDVGDDFVDPEGAEAHEGDFKKGAAGDFHEGLRA